ncbi:MAG: hypothetical protein ACXV1K_09435 [Kineosporiaceae bacterium]
MSDWVSEAHAESAVEAIVAPVTARAPSRRARRVQAVGERLVPLVTFSLGGGMGPGVVASGYPRVTPAMCPGSGVTIDTIESPSFHHVTRSPRFGPGVPVLRNLKSETRMYPDQSQQVSKKDPAADLR